MSKALVMELARTFEDESNAGFDLWTWLPSHKDATKHHGDHADNFKPSTADLLREATIYIQQLRSELGRGAPPTEHEVAEWFDCPCGEHERGG